MIADLSMWKVKMNYESQGLIIKKHDSKPMHCGCNTTKLLGLI